MDKILRWYIDGSIGRIKTGVGGTYYLDGDYVPEWVNLTVREKGKGNQPLTIDINVNGVSIFDTRPALTENQTSHKWTTIQGNTMREGAIVTCDTDAVFEHTPCRDLTVELGLRKV